MSDCVELFAPAPGQCPAEPVVVDWHVWWQVHVLWPVAAQLLLTVTFLLVLHPAYVEVYYRRGSAFQKFVKNYVGTPDCPKVTRPHYLVLLLGVEQLAAASSVCIWIWLTYSRETTSASDLAYLLLCLVDGSLWLAARLRSGCDIAGLWQLDALVDVLTMVPVLMRALVPGLFPEGYNDWLSLHFLRSYSALYCFEKARMVAQLDEHTAGMTQVMVQTVLRVVALLTVMAGTVLTLEILGDPDWLRDSFMVTHADDRVSFLQMVYWIVVSITTVGYGDFAPRTVFTRICTMFFIVVGVTSVYLIQFSFAEMHRRRHEGMGKYWQRGWGQERHVVVILCHHGSASRMASLIHGFLQELLHASHNQTEDHHDHASSVWGHLRLWLRGAPPAHMQTWPDVVFLSPTKWAEEGRNQDFNAGQNSFRHFLESTEDFPSRMLSRIWFLVGGITCENDLQRARVGDSALTYVLSDLKSATPDEDDAQTIYTAVVIRDMFPDVRLRLMVMKPESKELAVQAGIDSTRCFSSRELSASLLAQSTRCHGLIPAVTAMLKSVDAEDEEFFLRQAIQHPGRGSSFLLANPEGNRPGSQRSSLSSAGEANLCSLEELEKQLRKSQAQWCPSKCAYERADPWMFEYFEGATRCVFGFDLNARFEGLSYGKLVLEVYRECGALLLGVQQNGKLRVCPQGKDWRACEGQVCIAMARCADVLDACRQNPKDRTSWRTAFQAARKRRRSRNQREGRHIGAARLMGKRLQASLLEHLRGSIKESLQRVDSEPLRIDSEPRLNIKGGKDIPALLAAATEEREGVRCADLAMLPQSPSLRCVARQLTDPEEQAFMVTNSQDSWLRRNVTGGAADELSPVRALRRSLRDGEELVVLIVCHGEIWQQVRTFVANLRQDYLPYHQPVVVLAPTAPPPKLLEDCGNRVVCLQGSCLRSQTLVEAGVLEASVVVACSGEVSRQSRFFDYRMVLVGQELDCWLAMSRKNVFTTFELHDSVAAKHLPRLRARSGRQHQTLATIAGNTKLSRQFSESPPTSPKERRGRAQTFDEISPSNDEGQTQAGFSSAGSVGRSSGCWEADSQQSVGDDDDDADEKDGAGIEDVGHRRRSFSEWLWGSVTGRVAEEKSHDSILYHPRFAAGQVFTPELWGMMLGRMFYMPAVIELVEALVMPSRREQNAYPWQVRVPDYYIGRPYLDLLSDLALSSSLRCDDGNPLDDGTPAAGTANAVGGPPAVPIALYRLRADFSSSSSMAAAASPLLGGLLGIEVQQQHRLTAQEVTDQSKSMVEIMGGHRFMMLAPQPDTHLRDGDAVLVLGGKHFGKQMHDRGLLSGSPMVERD